jgi:hypothetical protein
VSATVSAPVLHAPDEPLGRADAWLRAVHAGRALDDVLTGDDGVTAWLWSRWRSLGAVGIDEAALGRIVLGYRRELWLWLAGERTWTQCSSGLIGRIVRRTEQVGPSGV